MIIHVVKEGETIDSIADNYGVPVVRLIQENELFDSYELVVGETLVILYPKQTHIIQDGDTLMSIADQYDVTVMQLLRNNPYLADSNIYPGDMIVISYEDNIIGKMSTNGYCYPFIDELTLKKTLPFLTYLTIYSYNITADGRILNVDDIEIIQMAKNFGVAPIMMLKGFGESQAEEINVTHTVLLNEDKREEFFVNLLTILKEKEFYGVNINTPYIFPEYRTLYVDFIVKFTERMHSEGFKVFNTISLNVFEIITGVFYKELEFKTQGQVVDGIMAISYQLGFTLGVPAIVMPLDTVKRFLTLMISEVPSEKVYFGVPNNGYMWSLPYEPGVTRGQSIQYNSAIQLARENGVPIQYDNTSNSAYFQFISSDEYIVRFRDARSIDAYAKLVPEFGINGIGIWNIMVYFAQMWLVINSQYEIEKIEI